MLSRVLVLVAIAVSATASAQEHLKPGETFRDCADCPVMVVIPAGSFMMGSALSERIGRPHRRGPPHKVTIARAFALGRHEVTYNEWRACLRDGGCTHRPSKSGRQPVAWVSWDQAKAYVRWLNWKTGQEYRLPSEAEWAYAARRENALGLQGMEDDVWEWVEDCYHHSYNGAPNDGSTWTTEDCAHRVLRGGSWYVKPFWYYNRDRVSGKGVGFRIARTFETSVPLERPPKRIARVAPSPPPEPAPRPKPKPRVRATPAPVPESQPDLKLSSTGSGFYVSGDGHVVTNEHVVEGCTRLRVWGADKAGLQARRMGGAANSDLALLKVDAQPRSFAVFRKGSGARPGEAVAVIGFPLAGYLASTANITLGNVSADAGPRDDPGILQITAPVQPGNSGGPLLDTSGHLVGVVVAMIKKRKIAEAFGRPPENVNFAIKARLVRSLLDAHGVNYRTEAATANLDPAGIYERARPFTVLIGCWK